MMEKQPSMFAWLLVAGLLSQNLIVIPVMASTTSFEDQKNYYSPDPHGSTPPSSLSPSLCNSHGHGHGHTPSHGSYGGSPPSHSTPSTPSGGGGSYNPTPSTPSTPSGGNCGTPPVEPPPTTPTPSTPSNPPSGGGGGYYPPTPSTPTPTPETPTTPTPETPTTPTPETPTTPDTPSPPTPSAPSPPYTPDPNSPYSCNYWRTHPGLIWGLFGWWGTTLGSAFGVTAMPGLGTSMSLQQALSNTRTDGYGTLYREGTASLLNSMVSHKFPYTTRDVRESFINALGSNKVAAAQGQLFKMANEGKLKTKA